MFLAINEIKQAKLRYGLILGLLFLIAYLMFFLTGLAYGLMQDNRAAVDQWKADQIILAKDSYTTLSLSNFDVSLEKEVTGDRVAPLAQLNTIAWSIATPTDKDKIKLSLFGVEMDSFLAPTITAGRMVENNGEMVIDETAAEKGGFQLGDTIHLSTSDKEFILVGYTKGATFSVAPVAYIRLGDFQTVKYGPNASKLPTMVNALIVKGKVNDFPTDKLETTDIPTFISKLSGYEAQNMTFAFMIGFLIVIAAIIIGIFMYILTIQKAPIFGVMKVQGISNAVISRAVLSQTFLLSLLGSSLGLGLTWLSSLGLPAAVPFMINWSLYLAIFVPMILFALLGTLFSVLAIVRIDPLKAIG